MLLSNYTDANLDLHDLADASARSVNYAFRNAHFQNTGILSYKTFPYINTHLPNEYFGDDQL